MAHDDKQVAYAADITYGTNNEFGFDYLRDNMVFAAARARAARPRLRDRRRGRLDPDRRGAHAAHHLRPGRRQRRDVLPAERARAQAHAAGRKRRAPGDYWVDEKAHQVLLSEEGHEHAEAMLAAGGPARRPGRASTTRTTSRSMHHLYAALRAHALFHRDQHYVVQNGEVIIVDEFTGRLMSRPALVRRPAPGGRGEGRRADPAREPDARVDHVPELLPHVRQARRHDGHRRHRGVRVPADLPPRDDGDPDAPCRWCARTRTTSCSARSQEKVDAIVADIKDCHARGQPVLVGTTSIENSELLSRHPRQGEAAAPGAEREAARARGARSSRRPARPKAHHDRDQHGRPRHGHRARRQHRAADPADARGRRRSTAADKERADRRRCAANGRSATTR